MSVENRASDPIDDAFQALGRKFRVIEMKYENSETDSPKRADLKIIPEENSADQESQQQHESLEEQEKTNHLATLNDRFRQSDPENPDVPGEWIYSDAIKVLAPTTKAAIKRKIRDYDISFFAEYPLHDHGAIEHQMKDATIRVVWLIKVFGDKTMLTTADDPENPDKSYRTLALALSDEE